jgi:anaphase-promoting complex subunit 8
MSNEGGEETMEMAWNPIVAVTDLRLASQILSDRCLKLSAKWCAEQWMGLPPEVVVSAAATSAAVVTRLDEHSSLDAVSTTSISEELLLSTSVLHQHDPAVQYSKAVFELGEYAHAAAILSETSLQNKAASVEIMPPPLPGLSPKATYFRAYALYMAGERAREQKLLELEGCAAIPCTSPSSVVVDLLIMSFPFHV